MGSSVADSARTDFAAAQTEQLSINMFWISWTAEVRPNNVQVKRPATKAVGFGT